MTNRQIALLILVGAFAALGGLYYFFLVRNVSSLVVVVNGPETSTVRLKKGDATIVAAECSKTCTIPEIPPFDYEMSVSATGFVTATDRLSIRSRDQVTKKFDLVRDVRTEGFRADRKEAIGEIRAKRAILSESGAEDAKREYVGQYGGSDYYVDRLPEFRLVERKGGWLESSSESSAPVETVAFRSPASEGSSYLLGDDGLLWISSGGASTLFDLATGAREYPPFPASLTKLAKSVKPGFYVAADADAAYSYDRKLKRLDKVPFYSDYVPLPSGNVLGLVRKGDKVKAELLNLGDGSESYVVSDA